MPYPQIAKLLLSCPVLAFALRDRYGRWEIGSCLLAGIALLALAAALTWALQWWKQRYGEGASNHPRKLFAALCQAHKLDRNQQRLLMLMAQRYELLQPAAVFLRPDLFDFDHLDSQLAAQFAQIQKLRQQLFGADIKASNLT